MVLFFYLKQVMLTSLADCYMVSDISILSLKLLLNILTWKWHGLKDKRATMVYYGTM